MDYIHSVPTGINILIIVSVILSIRCICTCVLFRTVSEIAISLYSSKIVDKKDILRTLSNTGIYFSRGEVITIYLVQYIFKNSTVNIDALCNSCEDMACCSSAQ
jgi:hypothetical protein